MQYQPIFSDKYLRTKLSNYSLNDITNIQDKQQKIVEWQLAIRKGSIAKTKEEALQSDFLNAFFGEILEYDYNRSGDKWNLEKEFKSVVDGTKADGALGYFSIAGNDARVVIELKDAKSDLDKPQSRIDKRTPIEQAFGYANKAGGKCKWVIVSNFKEIRLYNATDQSKYELFDILELLNGDNLKKFFFLLHKNRLMLETQKSSVDIIFEDRQAQEQKISKEFYTDYKNVRIELFNHLKQNNPQTPEVLLFTKAQKILDRIIFICFCEDLNLLPEYTFRNILKNSKSIIDFSDSKLWTQVKNLFRAIDLGYPDANINKFNGGLFAEDKELDNLIIRDAVIEHLVHLAEYDFDSDLNVNILGHIFEQSISDIEEIKAQIEGQEFDNKKGKRKKDGIFYTPEYITRYIVKEAVGGWLEDRKIELGVDKLPELSEKDYDSIKIIKVRDKAAKKNVDKLDYNKNIEKHILFWEAFREKLSNIKVLDPACGSGAFLNQVFDYLHREGEAVNNELAKLRKGQRETFDLDKHILTNNIFGVDLNPESVEITKLSLWLKTANRHKELTALDNNIQCGNSIIDDIAVAGDKAFKWEERFIDIMNQGGFDIIIGNPPYGAHLNEASKLFLPKKFQTFQGNFEIYFFFIEQVNRLIKSCGKIGYITPDTWINIPQAQKLRKHVLNHYGINTIVAFKHSVFSDASVNAIIFILTKGNRIDKCEVVNIETPAVEMFTGTSNINYCDVKLWENSKDSQFQIWQDKSDISLIQKIESKAKKGEEFLDVCQGIVPYSTEHLTKEEVKQRPYHNVKKINEQYGYWVQGRAIKRYTIDIRGCEYLKYGEWLHRARKPKYFTGKRILIQEITGGNPPRISAAICEETVYHDPGIISCLNISDLFSEYLLAIINSKLISWYNLKTSPKGKRSTFPKVLIGDIRKFPIVQAQSEQPFIEGVTKIMQLTIDLQNIQTSFVDLLINKYDIQKASANLQEWFNLEYNDFLKELKKLKIALTLSEEAEWMKFFNEQKQKAQVVKSEIAQIDRNIDQMVYKLYDLTPEEIKIVEGGKNEK